MNGYVFLSYARKDGSQAVERLEQDLARAQFKTWRDQRGIDPTQDFTSEIENAIESASFIVTCITPDVKRDDSFVRREIGYALALRKPIAVARFQQVIPPIAIVNHTWIDFFPQWDAGLDHLCSILRSPDQYRAPAASEQPQDPYKTYLETLYKQVVIYLDRTVFAGRSNPRESGLITLRSESSSEDVDATERQALPMAFFDQAGVDSQGPSEVYDSFQDAFEKYAGRVLLLGAPGSGKTITLMAFARDAISRRLADVHQPLPILAPLALWDYRKALPIADWLGEVVPLLKPDIAAIITQGTGLLLLDGLDELKGSENLESEGAADPRALLLGILPSNNQIVMTSRTADYRAIGKKAPLPGAVTLRPLDDVQVRQYLADAPELLATLKDNAELAEMLRVPLLLSLFAVAFGKLEGDASKLHDISRGEIRDAIFASFIQRRYEHEKRKQQGQAPFTLDELYLELGRAVTQVDPFFQGGGIWYRPVVFERDYLAQRFGEERGNRLAEFAVRLNILVPDQQDRLRFIHLLVRDHFAYRNALRLLGHDNRNDRAGALILLRELGDTRAIPQIIDALSDKRKQVRWEAVFALREMPDERAVDALIREFEDNAQPTIGDAYDQTPPAYWIARQALVNIGAPAVPPLIEALRHTDPEVRGRAAYTLGMIGDPRAREPLKELLARTAQGERATIEWWDQDVQTIVKQALEKIDAANQS